MESHVMLFGIVLCILAGGEYTESGRPRVKREFTSYQDDQDVGLAFVTIHSKPIHTEEYIDEKFGGPNQFSSNQFSNNNYNSNNNNQIAQYNGNNNQIVQYNDDHDNDHYGGGEFSFSASYNNNPDPAPPRRQESKIPGVPGVDYPMYHTIPQTSFRCSDTPAIPGMYANIETGCQVYHVCHDGRDGPQGASFLCTNGTLFNQKEFVCDWWYNVDCGLSLLYYGLNLDPLKNPYTKRDREEELRKYQEYGRYN